MKRWQWAAFAWLAMMRAVMSATVGMIEIDGAIGPATAAYVARAIDESARRQDTCLIVRLDTPGGLLDSTKHIVQSFYQAPVPVVVYVAPGGASATSAGCFITLAADVAAMAPGTSIGAAHPVALGGGGGGDSEQKPDDTMKTKMENYAASFIEAIAQKRQRNVEWAGDAVRKSASITAEKALELKVVEIIANDNADLLRQLDGRQAGARTLRTAGAEIAAIPMTPRERVFQVLWRPEVIFVLMLVAIYGLIGELSNPGAVFPGVVGAIAFILALYLGAALPIQAAGIALIVLAVVLFGIDAFAPTHGVLTIGGMVAFLLGAFMMFDTAEGALRLSWKIVLPATVVTAAFFLFVVGAGLRAQLLPARVGPQMMLGKTVAALTPIDAQGGMVFIEGETWSAVSDSAIGAGAPVEIDAVRGLQLHVKPKPDTS